MKHIKKKPLFEERLKGLTFETMPVFEKFDFKDINSSMLISRSKDSLMYISTTKNEILQAFTFNFNGTQLIIPLADYTLVYYDTAYNQNIEREQVQKEVVKKFTTDALYDEIALNLIYHEYSSHYPANPISAKAYVPVYLL